MNTTEYERPGIVRHQMGGINKFGQQLATRVQTHIEGVAIADLVARYGSPLFVFSERTLIDRYRELEQAFSRRYPSVRLAWSYKTNYLQAVCRVFHREGAFAEVVSPFEYDKAVALGIPPERIHFNGPFKPDDALGRAIAGGAILHVDNLDEISRIERIAQAGARRARVAIRVNQAIDGVQSWSRFGLNLESGQAHEAITRVVGGQAMDLVGLHTHIGTFIQDPKAYGAAAAKMARLANELRSRHQVRVSFIDLGGGFASPNTLKGQYLDGQQASPPFSRYAEAISAGLAELDFPAAQMPTLVLETGRALVDEAGSLISTVQASKRLPDGRRALVVDAGVNLLFTAFWYRHEVSLAQEVRGLTEATVLYGPLCMNIDVMRDAVALPPLSVGDRIVFATVGAYNVTQWMQFITLRPAVVMVGTNGSVAVIRRAETVDDLNQMEAMPAWLA
ncbi:MAG: diaminopimelate decarboxylase [Pseudomonadota bacterium]